MPNSGGSAGRSDSDGQSASAGGSDSESVAMSLSCTGLGVVIGSTLPCTSWVFGIQWLLLCDTRTRLYDPRMRVTTPLKGLRSLLQ